MNEELQKKYEEMIADAKRFVAPPTKRKSFRNRSSLAQIIKTKEQGERLLKTLYALQASNGQAI